LLESLETRTVLSAGGALGASLASAGSPHAPLAEEAVSEPEAETPRGLAVATAAVARLTAPVARITGLRIALASSTLQPRHLPTGKLEMEIDLSAPSLMAIAAGTTDSRLENLSPTSKYCRKYSSTLCKVGLDDDVDPIYKCPDLNDLFCLPTQPLP
jgi:hypothetical protein